jgi:hypothetical protein
MLQLQKSPAPVCVRKPETRLKPKPRSGKLTLKGDADRKFDNLAMIQKLNHRGYYEMATRQTAYPPSWRWRIVRRGEPMGVQIERAGFSTYEAARLAGKLELANFLEQLALEKSRIK